MGHSLRPPLALLRSRLRLLLHALYPSFVVRRTVLRPLSLISITFVLSLISMGIYLVVPLTLLPNLATTPVHTSLWLLLFSWTCANTIVCYLLTAIAMAGRVPPTWRPHAFQNELVNQPGVPAEAHLSKANLYPIPTPDVINAGTSMLRTNGRHRFCVHCKSFKPDRTHHCSSCQECVLQMDHHCPFTGNCCIGIHNRKFFILFLYYATLSCTLVASLTPRSLLMYVVQFERTVSTFNVMRIVLLLMGYILCTLHAIALAPFAAFHTYLVLHNRTTIENQEPRQPLHADVLRRMDRTWLCNWNATFGPSPWLWFLPITYGREFDGIRWHAPAHTIVTDDVV